MSTITNTKTYTMNEKPLHGGSSNDTTVSPSLPLSSLKNVGSSDLIVLEKMARYQQEDNSCTATANTCAMDMDCSTTTSSSAPLTGTGPLQQGSSYSANHASSMLMMSSHQHDCVDQQQSSSMNCCGGWNYSQEQDAGREHVMLLNKIGSACLMQSQPQQQEEAKRSFASALLELRKYAPLACESLANDASVLLQTMSTTGTASTKKSLNSANGQPNRSLYIYQRESYDEGMYMFQSPLDISSQSNSRTLLEATLLYNLGHAHIQTLDHQDAKTWFQLALKVWESESSTVNANSASSSQELSPFLIRHNLGNCCYRMGENEAALEHYQQALQLCLQAASSELSSTSRQRLLDLAASYNCVAVLCFHQSHPSEPSDTALEYLQIALASYTSVFGGSNNSANTTANIAENCCTKEVATVLSNIGRVYFLRADYEKALELFQRSLAIRQWVLEAHSVDIATAMFNVGQTHHRCGNLEAAMTYYRGFLETAQVQLGTEHRDFAAGLVLLSDVHRERKEYSTAQILLKQAIECGRAALGQSHPDLALIFNNLGSLSYELREYDEALQYYVECVNIQSEFLEPQHPHIVISLLNVAQIHKQKGDYNTAFKVYRQVYNIHVDTFGPDSMEVATTLSSMALMKYLIKDYRVSLNFYEEALRVHRLVMAKEPASTATATTSTREMDIAATLNSIGLVRFKMDDFDQAKDAFLECLNIRKRILGADHRDIAVMWYNLATIYLEKGEDQTAMKLYSESLRVERRALGDKHPEISLTLQHLGQMHQERGELEKAVEYFQEALEIERLVMASHGADAQKEREVTMASICKLLNLIGNIHLMCGRVNDMMACFVEACELGQHNGEALIIAGHNFYGLSRLHPPCAPLA